MIFNWIVHGVIVQYQWWIKGILCPTTKVYVDRKGWGWSLVAFLDLQNETASQGCCWMPWFFLFQARMLEWLQKYSLWEDRGVLYICVWLHLAGCCRNWAYGLDLWFSWWSGGVVVVVSCGIKPQNKLAQDDCIKVGYDMAKVVALY